MELPKQIFSGHWTGGHCQGIAVDTRREYIYYSFTTMLVKTDMEGRLVGSVTGLLGHLGCLAFCDDDCRLYGSLEYKNDAIGKGLLKNIGSDAQVEDAFYMAVFDVERITRPGMDACADGVMTAVYLKEVLDDYSAEVTAGGRKLPHRYGCSGIDGVTFAPVPGDTSGKRRLFVAYGVYGDVTRPDNDYQVLLCYDTADWDKYALPLKQWAMHRTGPGKPLHKFFVHTGNTTYGVQNLEYDAATGDLLMAVYRGAKKEFTNHALYAVDGKRPAEWARLVGVEPETQGEVLALSGGGWDFEYGSTGLCSLGDGRFYVSHDGRDDGGYCTSVRMYRWNGESPLVQEADV